MSVVLEQDPHLDRDYDAYFLVTHGSQEPYSFLFLQELIECVGAIGDVVVGGGCLEGQPIALSQQILQFCEEIAEQDDMENINVAIVPLFLLAGVHVMQDIPAEVESAQRKLIDSFAHLDRQITLGITPHLGTHSDIPTLLKSTLEAEISALKAQSNRTNIGSILLSHGSRRPEAVRGIEDLANRLGAITAYWSLPPSLDAQVEKLIAQGRDSIIVMPYLLSEGGITSAIAEQISLYADRIPIQIAPIPFSPFQIAEMAIDLAGF
jgi:sirohydrochlorin cobaltochelatase